MLPNFLIIGSQKSGTTWLYKQLKKHPEIFLPQVKEINYFNLYNGLRDKRDYFSKKNLKWYENFFSNVNNEKAIGEVSPLYLSDPLALKRIKQTLPKIKLLIILRNPIDRAYSNYFWVKRLGIELPPFEKLIKYDHYILNRSKYFKQINKVYDLFEKKLTKILIMEKVMNNPSFYLKEIFDFLDVDSSFKIKETNKKVNTSGIYRSQFLRKGIVKIVNFLRSNKVGNYLLNILKQSGLTTYIKKANKKEKKYPKLDKSTREKYRNYFEKEFKELNKLIKEDINIWENK